MIYPPLLNTFSHHFSHFGSLPHSPLLSVPFTLALSLTMYSSAPFHAHPFLPLPGNRVRDSVTL